MDSQNEYYFCYTYAIHKILHYTHKIRYIHSARHDQTLKKFWLYKNTPQVQEIVSKYYELYKGGEA